MAKKGGWVACAVANHGLCENKPVMVGSCFNATTNRKGKQKKRPHLFNNKITKHPNIFRRRKGD